MDSFSKLKRLALAVVALTIAASAVADASLSESLPERLLPGLEPVIQNALRHSEEMRSLALAQREAEGNLLQSRSSTLPNVRAYATARQENYIDYAGESSKDVVIYQLTATQPLYHWGARRAERAIGELAYDMAQIDSESSVKRLVASVRSSYMAAVIAQQSLAATDLGLAQLRRQLEFQREKAASGQLAELSLADAELNFERWELNRLRQYNEWQARLMELAQTSALDPEPLTRSLDASIPPVEPLSSEAIAALEKTFLAQLPMADELARKDLAIEVARRTLQIERQALKPTVDAQIGMSQNGLDENGVRRQLQFAFAGLTVNWNLFDGFRAKGRRMEALARLERNEQSKQILEAGLRASFARALARLDLAARSLRIESKAFARSEESRAKADSDFADQRISEAQYEESKRVFADASVGLQRIRAEYLNALAAVAQLLDLDPLAREITR